jgi:hypothetical protein
LETHKDELANHILAIESDSGNFDPYGFVIPPQICQLDAWLRLLFFPFLC